MLAFCSSISVLTLHEKTSIPPGWYRPWQVTTMSLLTDRIGPLSSRSPVRVKPLQNSDDTLAVWVKSSENGAARRLLTISKNLWTWSWWSSSSSTLWLFFFIIFIVTMTSIIIINIITITSVIIIVSCMWSPLSKTNAISTFVRGGCSSFLCSIVVRHVPQSEFKNYVSDLHCSFCLKTSSLFPNRTGMATPERQTGKGWPLNKYDR